MKKPTPILLLALLLAGCSRSATETASTQSPPPPASLNITTTLAKEMPMPRHLHFTGELQAERQATLAPNVSGIVVAAPIERGTMLQQGDIVLKLDDRAASLAHQEAEAALKDANLKLEWARSELARSQSLAKTSAISALEFDRLKLNLASAESTLAASIARRDSAQKTLDDMVLRAPFAGTVAERLTEVGEFVSTTKGVARLVATERLRLLVHVPEPEIGSIRVGQKVSFTVPAYPHATFEGTVKYLGAALRDTARDLAIEAEVPNADGRLKPGMFAQGRAALADEVSLTVPVAALRVDDTIHKVFVVVNNAIEERIVEVGETRGDTVEIRRGVASGEVVVLAPGVTAADGMKVAFAARL